MIPGFTAEASIFPFIGHGGGRASSSHDGSVIPAEPRGDGGAPVAVCRAGDDGSFNCQYPAGMSWMHVNLPQDPPSSAGGGAGWGGGEPSGTGHDPGSTKCGLCVPRAGMQGRWRLCRSGTQRYWEPC